MAANYGPVYGASNMKQPLTYQSATGGYAYSDLESGQQALFPGITVADQTLRWGFIRKVGSRLPRERFLRVFLEFSRWEGSHHRCCVHKHASRRCTASSARK